jgi:hypothetical protein
MADNYTPPPVPYAEHSRIVCEEIELRDDYQEWADKLAYAIAAATGVDIGEHSNMNHPWQNALDAIS